MVSDGYITAEEYVMPHVHLCPTCGLWSHDTFDCRYSREVECYDCERER